MTTTARGHAGADWLVGFANRPVSALGREVADLVGDTLSGLYHLPDVHDNDWTTERYIEVVWSGDLSTYDSDLLTHLVVGAHDRCLRLSISVRSMWARDADGDYRIVRDAEGPSYMAECPDCVGGKIGEGEDCPDCGGKGRVEVWLHQTAAMVLLFHKRERGGPRDQGHPTMEEAVAHVRGAERW